MEQYSAIKIQKLFRGFLSRKNFLPLIFYMIKRYLISCSIEFSKQNEDGRINSSLDENTIIKLLDKKYRIFIPKIRMWYDILVFYKNNWFPVNIKTTTMKTSDNTGNIAMCVYSYTNYKMDLYKSYKNGHMSKILLDCLRNNLINYKLNKDYHFIVLDKNDNKNIIVNSVKGLSSLTSNNNNLPFQVQWNKNKKYFYKTIKENIKLFVDTLQKPKKTWNEEFLEEIRKLNLNK
jgi:hypothetical protein